MEAGLRNTSLKRPPADWRNAATRLVGENGQIVRDLDALLARENIAEQTHPA